MLPDFCHHVQICRGPCIDALDLIQVLFGDKFCSSLHKIILKKFKRCFMPERIQLSTEWGYHVNSKPQWSWIISEKQHFLCLQQLLTLSQDAFSLHKMNFDNINSTGTQFQKIHISHLTCMYYETWSPQLTRFLFMLYQLICCQSCKRFE